MTCRRRRAPNETSRLVVVRSTKGRTSRMLTLGYQTQEPSSPGGWGPRGRASAPEPKETKKLDESRLPRTLPAPDPEMTMEELADILLER